MAEPTVKELERRVRQLAHKHRGRIERFLSRRAGAEVLGRTSLEDLYQDTLAEALQSADTAVCRSEAEFAAWILTIARRVVSRSIQKARKESRTRRIKRAASTGVGIPDCELSSGARTPSSIAAGQERRSDLYNAIQSLPEHYRIVLMLYGVDQFSLEEVAELTGRTKPAAAKLIARASRALRQQLDGS